MKHTKRVSLIALFTLLSFSYACAFGISDSITPLPVELKYAGHFNSQPLLQLNVTGSALENEFSISITDETGFVLYSVVAKGEKISKQFLLNRDDLGDAVLNFEISSRKTGKSVVFKVTPQVKLTEEMNVVRL
ncbi:MAG TPA: hypothetical protein VK489_00585 [Ferruginibacter sp.]|nr:hypothetical protein [Ferruginibacter sp.]